MSHQGESEHHAQGDGVGERDRSGAEELGDRSGVQPLDGQGQDAHREIPRGAAGELPSGA